METVGTYIKKVRNAKNITLRELAKSISVTFSYISQIENNSLKNPPSDDILNEFSEALQLTDEENEYLFYLAAYEKTPDLIKKILFEKDSENIKGDLNSNFNINNFYIPVYDGVSAGPGKYVLGETIDQIPIPLNYKTSSPLVGFRVCSDSMIPKIPEDSYILIKENIIPENGQIGVFVVGDEWYVKVFRKFGNQVILSSLNTKYEDMIIDTQKKFFRIIGKVVMVMNYI